MDVLICPIFRVFACCKYPPNFIKFPYPSVFIFSPLCPIIASWWSHKIKSLLLVLLDVVGNHEILLYLYHSTAVGSKDAIIYLHYPWFIPCCISMIWLQCYRWCFNSIMLNPHSWWVEANAWESQHHSWTKWIDDHSPSFTKTNHVR